MRPLKQLKRLPKRLFLWPYQRLTRGYSDQDTWEFDGYLAEVIAGGVAVLRDRMLSHPGDLTPERWAATLTEIETGFRIMVDTDWRYEQDATIREGNATKIDRAFDLLRQYFHHLWD